MKVRVHHREHGWQEYDVADGLLEVKGVHGTDPEMQPRFYLSDLLGLEVSEHPVPVSQTPPAPRLVEKEIDLTPRGYLHDGSGESARVGPKRSFRTMAVDATALSTTVDTVDHAPAPAKPRPKAAKK